MYISTSITTPPEMEPITLDFARRYARIDQPNDFDIFKMMVGAATDVAERFLNRSLITKTIELTGYPTYPNNQTNCRFAYNVVNYNFSWFENFNRSTFTLLYNPVITINSVTFGIWNASDYDLILNTDYFVDTESVPARIRFHLQNPPNLRNLKINYTAGYGTYSSVPPTIISAILIMALRLWEHRGDEDFDPDISILAGNPKFMLSQYRNFYFGNN